MTPSRPKLPFDLLRWYSLASLAVVAAIAVGYGVLISNYLSKHMLNREAEVTRDFVQNILMTDASVGFLENPKDPELAKRFRGSFEHFIAMKDILRTNVYSRDGVVLWSSDAALIGRKFTENDELEEALRPELVVHAGHITSELRQKPEHEGLPAESEFFVETYIPIMNMTRDRALGVVEIYKAPLALTQAIRTGHRQVWATAVAGAILLYLTLFWIVRRADRTIRLQQARLLEAETMAVVGELSSSVAHNIRNPLASIRSSAELAIELKGEDFEEAARDIIAEVDRIEAWMRELVQFAGAEAGNRVPLDAGAVLRECFDEHGRQLEAAGLRGSVSVDAPEASVNADGAVLSHVLHSLITNAIDATPRGGSVEGRVALAGRGRIAISVRDTGAGIVAENLELIFRPFFTTKPHGLGLGLALARKAIERFGGDLRVESTPGNGATMIIELPAA
jgi:signal transduction histidine kinase